MERQEKHLSKIKYPEMHKLHDEFFAPGEILDIKSQGDALIDPLPILSRFGIETNNENKDKLLEILRKGNRGLNIIDSEEGPKMQAKDIEELIRISSVSIWEIAFEVLPEPTRKVFFNELQIGLQSLHEHMVLEDKKRQELKQQQREKDWQK